MERPALNTVKKFYFLEYFYILLESIEKYLDKPNIFNVFKILKQKHRLGESKYKRNISEEEIPTERQVNIYKYTFEQVIEESLEYDLIEEPVEGFLVLTEKGQELLNVYLRRGEVLANRQIFKLMEERYGAFRYLIEFLYKANNFKQGLLVLPSYSPSQLGYEKSDIQTGNDIIDYLQKLIGQFEKEFQKYLGDSLQSYYSHEALNRQIGKILDRLAKAGLFPDNPREKYPFDKYNAITKRIRDYWINYFLQEIYKFPYSMAAFDIWCYRGKQVGIIHATEFYPNFSGRVVYPTSVVVKTLHRRDFTEMYRYDDKNYLLSHNPDPEDEKTQNTFVRHLHNAYLDLRRTNRSYFINLPPLREIVCYNMKISAQLFERLLTQAYRSHLQGNLKVRISLEVDRLPEETKAMYLKQEPVMIDGKYKNIIAIDITEVKTHEQQITSKTKRNALD